MSNTKLVGITFFLLATGLISYLFTSTSTIKYEAKYNERINISKISGSDFENIYKTNEYVATQISNDFDQNSKYFQFPKSSVLLSEQNDKIEILNKSEKVGITPTDYFERNISSFMYFINENSIYIAGFSEIPGAVIKRLDFNGILQEEWSTSFSFTDFGVDNNNNKIYYSPMNVYSGTEALTIIDSNNEIKKLHKLNPFLKKHPHLSSNCLKVIDGVPYFREPLTDNIFRIENDELVEIYSGEEENLNLTEIANANLNVFEAQTFFPTFDFFVSSEYVFLKRNENKRIFICIHSLEIEETICHLSTLKLTNLDHDFGLYFDNFQGFSKNQFYSINSMIKSKELLSAFTNANTNDHIEQELKLLLGEKPFLHKFEYDFEKLKSLVSKYQNRDGIIGDIIAYPNPIKNDILQLKLELKSPIKSKRILNYKIYSLSGGEMIQSGAFELDFEESSHEAMLKLNNSKFQNYPNESVFVISVEAKGSNNFQTKFIKL